MSGPIERFPLRLRGFSRLPLLLYGVRPGAAYVQLDDERFLARFGWFRFSAQVDDIGSFEVTGPYRPWRVLGVRRSLSDRGLTFGSSAHAGVCLCFRRPVRWLFLRPPALTVTVDDIGALVDALRRRAIEG